MDHFVAKSQMAGLAYECSNYRLACTTMNARKHDYSTVLDPCALTADTFHLELVTGRLYPSPSLTGNMLMKAQQTIDRLGIDDGGCREMRARRYSDYLLVRGQSRNTALEAQLKRYAPFIWSEAHRQGLL